MTDNKLHPAMAKRMNDGGTYKGIIVMNEVQALDAQAAIERGARIDEHRYVLTAFAGVCPECARIEEGSTRGGYRGQTMPNCSTCTALYEELGLRRAQIEQEGS